METQALFLKIIVIGDSGVGKTCLIHQFCYNQFKSITTTTVGCDFSTKVLPKFRNKTVKLQLWDIAGQDRYKSFTKLYLRGATGCVIVADITNDDTILSALSWHSIVSKFFEEEGRMNIPFILFLNKVDLIPLYYSEQKEIPFSSLIVDRPQSLENGSDAKEGDFPLREEETLGIENKNSKMQQKDKNKEINFPSDEDVATGNEIKKPKIQVKSKKNEIDPPLEEYETRDKIKLAKTQLKTKKKEVDFPYEEDAARNEVKKLKMQSHLTNLLPVSFPIVLEAFKKDGNFLGFIETSAKENRNLKEGIGDLVEEIIQRRKEENKEEEGRMSEGQKLKEWEEKERVGCCGR